jgi:hypothetical protein
MSRYFAPALARNEAFPSNSGHWIMEGNPQATIQLEFLAK